MVSEWNFTLTVTQSLDECNRSSNVIIDWIHKQNIVNEQLLASRKLKMKFVVIVHCKYIFTVMKIRKSINYYLVRI